MEIRSEDEQGKVQESISWSRLQSILKQQDSEVAAINTKLDKLNEVPADVKILTNKVESLIGMTQLLHQVNNTQSTHTLALKIIGTACGLALPILAAWSTKLNTEINYLQNKIVKLETLQEVKKDGR